MRQVSWILQLIGVKQMLLLQRLASCISSNMEKEHLFTVGSPREGKAGGHEIGLLI